MWLRGATSSLLVSFLFAFAYFWFVENQSFSQAFQGNLVFLTLFFFLGIYTSSMIIVYGKQIKRRIRREKGQIKWSYIGDKPIYDSKASKASEVLNTV